MAYLKSQTTKFNKTENTFQPQYQKSKSLKTGEKVERNTQGYYDKKGWILKKATSTYMGMANWQRRFIVLKNDRLYFYETDSPKDMLKAKKMIDMKNTKCCCYHYDQFAPIKSQKLGKGIKTDKSRFDIYTPGRVFNLKSEFADYENSDEWLAVL